MKRKLNPLFFLGLFGFFLFGSFCVLDFISTFFGDKNIYWTNSSMLIPFKNSGNNFEIYVKDGLLQKRVEERRIFYYEDDGSYSLLNLNDLKYRENNYFKVKSSILTRLFIYSFLFGLSIGFLFTGLFKYVIEKGSIKNEGNSENKD